MCFGAFLELVTRVELATCGLRYRCSAIEPHQREIILLQKILFVNRKNQGIAFCLKVWYNYMDNGLICRKLKKKR